MIQFHLEKGSVLFKSTYKILILPSYLNVSRADIFSGAYFVPCVSKMTLSKLRNNFTIQITYLHKTMLRHIKQKPSDFV